MNKKLTFAALSALMLTACSNDDLLPNGVGEPTDVSFSVALPEMMATRTENATVGKGYGVERLFITAFTKDKQHHVTMPAVTAFSGDVTTTTQTLNLVKGETYDIVFWADSGNGTYTYNEDDGTVTIDYNKFNANDEAIDAFSFYYEDFVAGTSDTEVRLKRMLAQVNIGSTEDDFKAAKDLGVEVSNTSFEITYDTYDTLDLRTGELGGNEVKGAKVVYTSNTRPGDFLSVNSQEYHFLGSAYLPASVGGDILANVNFLYEGCTTDRNYPTIPVRRNHRTNIIGQILTNPYDFKVVLDTDFNTQDINVWDGSTSPVEPVSTTIDGNTVDLYSITLASELAWVAKNVTADNAYIQLAQDIDLNNLTFPGFGTNDRKAAATAMFNGVFDGNGMTISNLKVDCTTDDHGSGLIRTANNATIKNVTIKNVTMTSDDFMGGVVGFCKGVTTIENCHVVNCNLNCYDTAGGILGKDYGEYTAIRNCTVSGNISGMKAGGILAHASYNIPRIVVIENCVNEATITVELNDPSHTGALNVGGMIGLSGKGVAINKCINKGTVGNVPAIGNAIYCGSMVGYYSANVDGSYIHNCENYGELKGKSIGSIMGIIRGSGTLDFKDNTNKGKVNYTGYTEYGNFGGYGSVAVTSSGYHDLYTE